MVKQIDAVVVGIHIVDILGRPVERIPDGQGVALIDEIRVTVAGTGAGTAVDMARLGLKVAAIGAVGDDELGKWLRQKMSDEGVDVSGIVVVPDVPTSATMLPIRPNGQRPALHVIGANAKLSLDHIDWDLIAAAKHVHVGGTTLMASLDGAPTAELLKRSRGLGAITSLDLISMPGTDYDELLGQCYPHLDYLLPNDEDVLILTGADSLDAGVEALLDRGVGAAAVTLGEAGTRLAPRGEDPYTVPTHAVNVIDTTGCGDAFSAGFIAGLVEGRTPLDAVRIGNGAGACVATGLGSDAGLTTRAALDEFIAETPLRS